MGVYVEILIRAPMEALWEHTQNPALHQRWDLRFTEIEYLPRARASEPQRFRYTTRLGFGLAVSGEGESVGERNLADGSRSSALKFGSRDRRALIEDGSGYWKYLPTSDGIRFLTWYDYQARYGRLGAAFDRLLFRPLIGWATAWSFDRLRLWLEAGVEPAQAWRQTLVHAVTRLGLALVFAYHGVVPKLLGPHPDELALLQDAGISGSQARSAAYLLGGVEVLLAVCLVLFWHRRWPSLVCLGVVILATLSVAWTSPRYLAAAFNPVSLNVAVGCLALIDQVVLRDLPSAGRCLRRPPAKGS